MRSWLSFALADQRNSAIFGTASPRDEESADGGRGAEPQLRRRGAAGLWHALSGMSVVTRATLLAIAGKNADYNQKLNQKDVELARFHTPIWHRQVNDNEARVVEKSALHNSLPYLTTQAA